MLSSLTESCFIPDKKKPGKRIKIVELQKQQNVVKPKKQKIDESNGIDKASSIEEGKAMLQWLLTGIGLEDFMRFV